MAQDLTFRGQFRQAVRAARVASPTAFAWFGRIVETTRPDVARAASPELLREHLTESLARKLYSAFYVRGRPISEDLYEDVAPPRDEAFVQRLSAAHAGGRPWVDGWQVVRVEGDELVVRRGLTVRARAAECRPAHGHRAGDAVRLPLPKDYRYTLPGFFSLHGATGPLPETGAVEVRLYFHLVPAGAVALVEAATTALNRAGAIFELKVADAPGAYFRCDSAVLYLRARDVMPLAGALRTVVAACRPYLRPETPPFTLRLAPGVSLAEQRGGSSFGRHRCRAIAEGMVNAYEARDDPLDRIAERFAAQGLSIDAPFRASGSRIAYAL